VYAQHGTVQDWGRVGVAAAVGGTAGLLSSLGAGTLATVAIAGTGKALGGMTNRLIQSQGRSAGTWDQVAGDFAGGAMAGAFSKGAGTLLSKGRPSPPGSLGGGPAPPAPTPSSTSVPVSALAASAPSVATPATAASTAFTPISINPLSLGIPSYYSPCVRAEIVAPQLPMFVSITFR